MNKKLFLPATACLLLVANPGFAVPPVDNNYTAIDASTAQAYVANYKNTVSNKFAEYYALDATAITNIVNAGASAIRIYNGLSGDGTKLAVMVPVDANYANMTGGSQMASITTIGICPPACDITKGASATMMTTSNAQSAAMTYYNNTNYDTYNAFLVYPAAITALRTWGAVNIQICNAKNPTTGARCMIYRGVNASGNASYLMEDAASMGNHVTM